MEGHGRQDKSGTLGYRGEGTYPRKDQKRTGDREANERRVCREEGVEGPSKAEKERRRVNGIEWLRVLVILLTWSSIWIMNVEECEAKTEHMWQFAHVGRIASDASSYLLRGTFPLREIDEQKDAVKRLRQSLRLVYDDLPNGETKDLLHQNMELIDAVMRSTNNKLSDIYSILDNGAHAIMKRSIVVAAGLAALVNLGLGQLAHLFIILSSTRGPTKFIIGYTVGGFVVQINTRDGR